MELHFVNTATEKKAKGVIVGSLFPVAKVKGWSLKFKSKIRDEENKLIDMAGKKLMDINYGDGFLIVPNKNKREGRRDPDFVVLAYPDEEQGK